MTLPRSLATFNRVVTNRVLGLLAPWLPPFAEIVHRGRSSGRTHRTPVWAFRRNDRLVVALAYGSGSDWVRNTLAEGGCWVVRLGRRHAALRPRIVRAESGRGLVPPVVVPPLRMLGGHEFLVLDLA